MGILFPKWEHLKISAHFTALDTAKTVIIVNLYIKPLTNGQSFGFLPSVLEAA